MAQLLTKKGGVLYFALEPSGKLAAFFTGKFNEALADKADNQIRRTFSERFIDVFNRTQASEAIRQTLWTRTGEFATPGAVSMYIAREGRRKTPTVLRVRTTAPQASVQEEGRKQILGTPTISESGRSFTIGGGDKYFVPLFSYFGRKTSRDTVRDAYGKYVIGRKIFKKRGVSYLLAYEKSAGGAAWNALRKKVNTAKGKKGKRRLRSSSRTRQIWRAMFAIFVGKHTGIPGVSASHFAKRRTSPGKWFSKAVGDTTNLTLYSTATEIEQGIPYVLAQILGLPLATVEKTFFTP